SGFRNLRGARRWTVVDLSACECGPDGTALLHVLTVVALFAMEGQMIDRQFEHVPLAFLRLQSWLSPSFPNGAYSYSHGLEWAVEANYVSDRASLVEWLVADLCYGSGRNEAIFFSNAHRCVTECDETELLRLAELAAAFRGTSEFALESIQQSS